MTSSLSEEESTRLRFDPRVMAHRKDEAANSTDSQFYGINKYVQFAGENLDREFEGESKPVSKYCNSLFRRMNSLFWQNTFPVPCGTGNYPQPTVIAMQMSAETQWKATDRP